MAQKGCFMRGVLIFSRPPEAEDTPLDPPRAQNGLRIVKNVILSENEAAFKHRAVVMCAGVMIYIGDGRGRVNKLYKSVLHGF